MEALLEQVRDQQKDSWNRFSPGWKKWDRMTMDFLRPMGDAIIDYIKPQGKQTVLDIAAGTGEPGLTIAGMLDGGKVISTDLAEGMLTIAQENAKSRGLANFETKLADVSELPFAENSFDAVSCRFGFMFFPDMQQAANEMVRVLKPGGRLATTVWNIPDKNFWVTAIMGTINRNMELPAPVTGAPSMFRCAAPGMIVKLFENAGFDHVEEREVLSKLKSGTTDIYWQMMNEVAAPVVAALSNADEQTKARIKSEVYDLLNRKFPDGNVEIDSSALLITGQK